MLRPTKIPCRLALSALLIGSGLLGLAACSNEGQPLLSATAFDSEGVATTRKTLVENGRLNTLLSSRAPAIAGNVSPGNLQGMAAAPTILQLQARNGLDETALLAELGALLRDADQPFALEVERFSNEALERRLGQTSFRIIMGGSEQALPHPARINKIWPDGRREPVRGVMLADIGIREFRNLAAIGNNASPVLRLAGLPSHLLMLSWRSTPTLPITYFVPDLLFEELSASQDTRQTRRRPLLGKPSASNINQGTSEYRGTSE